MKVSIIKKIAQAFFVVVIIAATAYGGLFVIKSLMAKGAASGPQTIEQVSAVNFDRIDHIESTKSKNKSISPEEFSSLYGTGLYEPYSGAAPTKKGTVYRCYDSDDTLILTLTEYPTESVIEINNSGEISLYKKAETSVEDSVPRIMMK